MARSSSLVHALQILSGNDLEYGCDLRIPLIKWCLSSGGDDLLSVPSIHDRAGWYCSAFEGAERNLRREAYGNNNSAVWSLQELPELKERIQIISELEGGFDSHGNTPLHYLARYGIRVDSDDLAEVIENLM